MKAGTVHELWKRARRVDAEELQAAAHVAVALVGRRLGAGVERPHDDGIAGAESLDIGADFTDGAGHLVADDLRWSDAAVHRSVGDVKVGAADSTVGDVEPHLAVAWNLRAASPHTEGAIAVVVRGLHK